LHTRSLRPPPPSLSKTPNLRFRRFVSSCPPDDFAAGCRRSFQIEVRFCGVPGCCWSQGDWRPVGMVDLDSRERERDAAQSSGLPGTRGSHQLHLRRPAPPQHLRRHGADDPQGESRGLPPRDSPPSLRSPSPRYAARDSSGEILNAARPREEAARARAGDTGHRGAASTRREVVDVAGRHDGAREVAGSVPTRKEVQERGRKRSLTSASKHPALKRRVIPVDNRVPSDKWREEAIPLRRNRDANSTRACATRVDNAREKVASRPPLWGNKDNLLVGAVPPRAVDTRESKKVSASDGAAQTTSGGQDGARSWGMKSSEALRRSAVPGADGLLDLDSQRVIDYTMQDKGKGTGELQRKESVPTIGLPSNPRMGSAKVMSKSNDKIKDKYGRLVTPNGIAGSDEVPIDRVMLDSVSANKHPTAHKKGLATDKSSFGPTKKGDIEAPDHPEIKVVPATEMENLANRMVHNLKNDETLSTLAISKGKIILYIKNSMNLHSLRLQSQYGVQNEDARSKFKMICRRFDFICRALVHAVEQHLLKISRIDTLAVEVMKKLPDYSKLGPAVGQVFGIEVGDEFLYQVQLSIVGLHRKPRAGIDWIRDKNGIPIATSIVSSGGYPDEMARPGELIYTGSGGKLAGKKRDEDQKLKLGNLALKNCIDTNSQVRVIYGFKSHNVHGGSHSMGKMISTYIYDGLYRVEECKMDGEHGSKMFKFKLQRVLGQPKLPLRIVKGMMKSKMRRGLCTVDNTNGKEDTASHVTTGARTESVDQEEERLLA
ncbi:hypothetical protein EJB05_49438, partial [Eragrostis curvula]